MTLCERCYKPEHIGEHGHMKCPLERRRSAPTVWADDIPGGVEIHNAICNADGSPRRYYSKSEIKLACEMKGIIPYHDVYQEGGETRIKDAQVHDAWLKSGEAQRASRDRDEQRRGARR
jgi:hypothetical protein